MARPALEIPPADAQLAVLTQGVADLNSLEELEQRLRRSHERQEPLVVKTGFDPTAPDLHLGHTVLIEKMAQFQRFGHDVVFLVGDYTARIGDPTGRDAMRPVLTPEQIAENAATYTEQCFKILDRDRTRIEWNSTWLAQLGFDDVIRLCASYNLGRMLERRDFKTRFEEGRQIALHEFLYPLVQAYDSVALRADVELGGHDQIFNLNVGRHVMAARGMAPQVVLTVALLVGTDGVDKMSKSKGNHVGITEPADTILGKVMSIADETMRQWSPLLMGVPIAPDEPDPLAAKKRLAHAMVRRFHGAAAADDSLAWWNAGRPVRETIRVQVASGPLFRVVHQAGAAKSGGEARRKISQGGVSLDDVVWQNPIDVVPPGEYVLKVGKKWAAHVVVHAGEP